MSLPARRKSAARARRPGSGRTGSMRCTRFMAVRRACLDDHHSSASTAARMRPPAAAPHPAATHRAMRAGRPKPERTIDSLQNPLVKRTRALELDRGLRDREGLYLAWGLHLALEAIAIGVSLERGMVGPALERSVEGREILERLRQRDAPILRVSTRILESIVPGAGDQGILLVA